MPIIAWWLLVNIDRRLNVDPSRSLTQYDQSVVDN